MDYKKYNYPSKPKETDYFIINSVVIIDNTDEGSSVSLVNVSDNYYVAEDSVNKLLSNYFLEYYMRKYYLDYDPKTNNCPVSEVHFNIGLKLADALDPASLDSYYNGVLNEEESFSKTQKSYFIEKDFTVNLTVSVPPTGRSKKPKYENKKADLPVGYKIKVFSYKEKDKDKYELALKEYQKEVDKVNDSLKSDIYSKFDVGGERADLLFCKAIKKYRNVREVVLFFEEMVDLAK